MQFCNLTIGSALTIAIVGIQSAAWSFTPINLVQASSNESYQLPTQPVTSGEAASQDFDKVPNSNTQPSIPSKQPNIITESGTQNSNVSEYRPTDCQFIPQTSGGLALKQLEALSKCNSGS
ncbi:MAG: hypothetical protein KME10_12405 [Plectolyngbya sp. WJT66-NPBG17]|jgi:hypothetical protein|nr:hypothetical protein [Plectolyngbya sp. WJT66-NPBG17]